MNTLLIYLPFTISFLMGYFLLDLILSNEKKLALPIRLFLAGGLGLGLSAHITFYSFIIFDRLNTTFVIAINIFALMYLLTLALIKTKGKIISLSSFHLHNFKSAIPYLVIILLSAPLWYQTHFYAYGGWDAWSTWNLKAKFLFLGEDHWKNIFDPVLWRSSPHYPLLLPLINVWGWSFSKTAVFGVPVFTAFSFSFMTVGLLYASLYKATKSIFPLFAIAVLLTLPYFLKLSYSQYADVILSYYILASFVCLTLAKAENNPKLCLVAGICIGFLSFTKGEGLVAAFVIALLFIPYMAWKNKQQNLKKFIAYFFAGAFIAALPTILFQLLYSPQNQTFINGLISPTKPATFYRLKIILSFYLVEFVGQNWNGLWIVLVAGLICGKGKCFQSKLIIIPLFLLIYTLIITIYYFLNTHFEIHWWLQVSLHRIMYAVLPLTIFWTFCSLWQDESSMSDVQS